MVCATTTQEVKLEPVTVTWGRKHCRAWTTVADTAGSLNNTYLDLNALANDYSTETLRYVWFNVNSSGVDPAPAGKSSGIEVALATGATAAAVATAIAAAVDADASFSAAVNSSDSTRVDIENAYLGPITAETDSGSTGFTLATNVEGIGGSLGQTAQGGSTLNIEAQSVELFSDQKGQNVVDEVMVGTVVNAEMSLIEVTPALLETIIGKVSGGQLTPSGGTELTGFGESKLFNSALNYAGQLILHPVRLATSDRSRDVVLHKCIPLTSSINYSGTDQQELAISFKAFLDSQVNTTINKVAWGDWDQDLA